MPRKITEQNDKVLALAMLAKIARSETLLSDICTARFAGRRDPLDSPDVVARHASRVKRLYQDSEEGEVGVPVSVAAAIDAATARDVLSCREELVEKAIAAYLQAHPRGTEGLPKDWQTTLALAEQQIEGQVKDAFRDNFVGELAQSERAERDQQKDRSRSNDRGRGE